MRVKVIKMLKITNWDQESTFQVILSIFQIYARKRPRARFVRAQRVRNVEMPFFLHFWIPYTILNKLKQFSAFSDLP